MNPFTYIYIVIRSRMGVIKLDKEMTIAKRFFGENYKWVGGNRMSMWDIYKRFWFLGILDRIIYWGTIVLAHLGLYRVLPAPCTLFGIFT